MSVHVIHDEALGNASYLVDVGDGLAVSVDPRRDIDEHLEIAGSQRLQIRAVLETHLHADFVSGSREIAAATGAEIVAAGVEFPHLPAIPGKRLTFGRCSIEVIGTPGHTHEHVAYLIDGGRSLGVFSGGSLIAGGAGRTDLSGDDATDHLARAQRRSIHAIASIALETPVYPTHGAGSFCSSGTPGSAITTVGNERATNRLLAVASDDEFVDALRESAGSYPRYFAHLRSINQSGAAALRTLPPVPKLTAEQAHKAAWLIDTRRVDEWSRAHAAGSISIELRPAFAPWLGWVVPFGDPFVLILEPDRKDEAARLARRIGYDPIQGWLTFDDWRDGGGPVSSIEQVEPVEAMQRGRFLDVRQSSEVRAGRIAGAEHVELGDIIAGKTPSTGDAVAYCGHGERSATAASLLARRGVRVANLRGGLGAWRDAGLPIER